MLLPAAALGGAVAVAGAFISLVLLGGKKKPAAVPAAEAPAPAAESKGARKRK